MVVSPFIVFLLGTISASVAVYSEASLYYAVEGAARCYSADTNPNSTATQCGTAATTQSYAKTLYLGTGSPTFTASLSTTTCGNATNPGHQVNATLTLPFTQSMAQWTIPSLSATACFP